MRSCSTLFFVAVFAFYSHFAHAQFTTADLLRGSNGLGRMWWDLQKYDLAFSVDDQAKRIFGENKITFSVQSTGTHPLMQIDLMEPMQIDSVADENNQEIKFNREGNVYWLDFGTKEFRIANRPLYSIRIQFSGSPHEAKQPPWEGGWVWATDLKGRPFVSAEVQDRGGSAWFPCKDYEGDKPDLGATITITPPDDLVAIANGRGKKTDGKYRWAVQNPISAFNIAPFIAHYTSWRETFYGEFGPLDIEYSVIDYNMSKAKEHFKQVPMALRAFEYWFGPYPFYEDSFKIVEAPFLGAENQSAIAYGNHFKNGYAASVWPVDISGTGIGLQWDAILVHEISHEWFCNSITAKDVADMWVHEAFTSYGDVLFAETYFGREAADAYCIGTRKRIRNDTPIIGAYGVHNQGGGDMYFKGANMLHTIRQLIGNDERFRQILRGLSRDFYHQTVTSQLIENYITDKSGINLVPIFDQYLRSTHIPELEYKIKGTALSFRWIKVIDGFNMKVKLTDGTWLSPTTDWKTIDLAHKIETLAVDQNFYVTSAASL